MAVGCDDFIKWSATNGTPLFCPKPNLEER